MSSINIGFFNITYLNTANVNTTDFNNYKNVFNDTFTKWISVLPGNQPLGILDITIDINQIIIDNVVNTDILGSASILKYNIVPSPYNYTYGVNLFPKVGKITINSVNIFNMYNTIKGSKTRLYYTTLHEIGHVLGIGTMWGIVTPDVSLPIITYEGQGKFYTGINGLREYRNYFNYDSNRINYVGIPIENDGGSGTAGGHFEEGPLSTFSKNNRIVNGILHPPLDQELMTGISENNNVDMPLSKVTIGVLNDIGYNVDYSKADEYLYPITPYVNDISFSTQRNNTLTISLTGNCYVPNITLSYAVKHTSTISRITTNDLNVIPNDNTFYRISGNIIKYMPSVNGTETFYYEAYYPYNNNNQNLVFSNYGTITIITSDTTPSTSTSTTTRASTTITSTTTIAPSTSTTRAPSTSTSTTRAPTTITSTTTRATTSTSTTRAPTTITSTTTRATTSTSTTRAPTTITSTTTRATTSTSTTILPSTSTSTTTRAPTTTIVPSTSTSTTRAPSTSTTTRAPSTSTSTTRAPSTSTTTRAPTTITSTTTRAPTTRRTTTTKRTTTTRRPRNIKQKNTITSINNTLNPIILDIHDDQSIQNNLSYDNNILTFIDDINYDGNNPLLNVPQNTLLIDGNNKIFNSQYPITALFNVQVQNTETLVISNLTLIAPYISNIGGGAFIEKDTNNVKLINCVFIGNLENINQGGLIGSGCKNISLINCSFYGNINYKHCGGLVGKNCSNIKIKRCYVHSIINGIYCGGLVGSYSKNIKIYKSYFHGKLKSKKTGTYLGLKCKNAKFIIK
jgi:hypothetical protein